MFFLLGMLLTSGILYTFWLRTYFIYMSWLKLSHYDPVVWQRPHSDSTLTLYLGSVCLRPTRCWRPSSRETPISCCGPCATAPPTHRPTNPRPNTAKLAAEAALIRFGRITSSSNCFSRISRPLAALPSAFNVQSRATHAGMAQ